MFERRSALARFPSAGAGGHGGARVRLSEVAGWHLAHVTAFGADDAPFRQSLAAAFGAEPPRLLYRGATHGQSRLIRLTRDQYWWIATDDGALRRFAQDLSPSQGAVTMQSAGRVRVRIEGPAAREVLAGGIAIDLDPAAFVLGQSAQTGLHHTGILLERVAEDGYELYLPRTYAATIWDWLIDATLPYGANQA